MLLKMIASSVILLTAIKTLGRCRLQKGSPGHLFMVQGGGIIDKCSPLFKYISKHINILQVKKKTSVPETKKSKVFLYKDNCS